MTEEKVSAQGLLDGLFLDKATIGKIKQIIMAVDPEKIRSMMKCVEIDQDGWCHIKIDLAIKR